MRKLCKLSLFAATAIWFATSALAVTCQLGNHGAVRGRPQVTPAGTLVADDGCPLNTVGAFTDGNNGQGWTNGYNTSSQDAWGAPMQLSWYQDVVNTGHFNGVRLMMPMDQNDQCSEGAPDPWYSDPISTAESEADMVVNFAQQTGLYVIITLDPCPDNFNNDATWWQTMAPRYANVTNVILEMHNEPDNGALANICSPSELGTLYQTVRPLAPNSPLIAFTYENTYNLSYWCNPLQSLVQGSGISFSSDNNIVMGFHAYDNNTSDVQTFMQLAQSDGYPIVHTEGWPSTVAPPPSDFIQLVTQTIPIQWQDSDGWPDPSCSSYMIGNSCIPITWAADVGGSGGGIDTSAWYEVVNQDSGYCIDDYGWGTSNGTVLDQWPCAQQYNQEWQFRQAATSGYYAIFSRYASPLVVDNYGSLQNGGGVYLWSYSSGDSNQEWQPQNLGNGLWRFVSLDSGMCLDNNGQVTEGTQMITWTCSDGNPNQEFSLVQE